ncbi:amidohydrolase family protein [Gemmatimonas groenlandica]|uniref:amidohydrolase family protein n=1 Tax=Gemmatimonas groenlandica TaxID=2732249 RepID=UPI00197DF56A|nr:amidohydrolase family protein [Gemmatimonas groenlandica]
MGPLISLWLVLSASSRPLEAQRRLPVLDMHMHAREAAHYGATGLPICAPVIRMPRWDQRTPFGSDSTAPAACSLPLVSPTTDAALLRATLASMARFNVIGVLGGTPELVAAWQRAAPGRFISGLDLRFDASTGAARAATAEGVAPRLLPIDTVRALYDAGAFTVLAEVMNQYAGMAPDDPRLEPYWAFAEARNIPVGIHVGGGGPAEPYTGSPAFRARLQSALTLEEVLVRHPKLRLYVMHAGYPLREDLQALLFTHPQVYVELSMAVNVEARPAFYRFLRELVDAGYGDRIMFGSDQMVWPGLIDAGVRSIEAAPFLNARQKRDILYNNAARFLRLSPAAIARHHMR